MRFDKTKALQNEEANYLPIEKALNYVFYEVIYKPLITIINEEITDEWSKKVAPEVVEERKKELADSLRAELKRNKEVIPQAMVTNSKGYFNLIKAILKGQVQYTGKHFEGVFSSAISREIRQMGGKWDKRRSVFAIDPSKIDFNVQTAIGTVGRKGIDLARRLDEHLSKLWEMIKRKPQFQLNKFYEYVIDRLDKRFRDGVEGIVVAPELTDEMKAMLAREYTYNMNLSINGWIEESIIRLRKKVQKNAFSGYRSEKLVKSIEHDYQVSHSKAKFLARQETSLLMSEFREQRYKSVGVNEYRWSTSGDQRVRPMHKALNGKIFTWDNPPIVDEKGRRAHPGQDWGCRCIAIPIFR